MNVSNAVSKASFNEVDDFLAKYGGLTESYWFYEHSVELRFAPKEHVYYKVMPDGELVAQAGVSSVSGIIDKSNALVPWACKMMAQEILDNIGSRLDEVGTFGGAIIPPMSYPEFEAMILAAKSAHKKKLDYASFVGNIAHDWIERHITGVLRADKASIPFPTNIQATSCCLAAISWMLAHNVRWICTEKQVYSRGYGYAGTMDGLCMADNCGNTQCCRSLFRNQLCLVDWKSSNALREEYLLQTAAYQYAYQEEYDVQIYGRWVIRLGKEDGEFEPWFVEDMEDDWLAFRHALGLRKAVDKIEQRMKDHEAILRAERKVEKQKAKEEALTIKCKGADRYKGIRKPACNGGNPCQTCITKYQEKHPESIGE